MLTQDRLWSEAVILEGQKNRVLRVQSTRDAFLCLKNHWPIADGDAKRDAFAACERVIEGNDEPDAARSAFIKAAEEAQFSVHSWTS